MKRKNAAAVALGKRKSEKKAASSRENGKLGGRPKKPNISAANGRGVRHARLNLSNTGSSTVGHCL